MLQSPTLECSLFTLMPGIFFGVEGWGGGRDRHNGFSKGWDGLKQKGRLECFIAAGKERRIKVSFSFLREILVGKSSLAGGNYII